MFSIDYLVSFISYNFENVFNILVFSLIHLFKLFLAETLHYNFV